MYFHYQGHHHQGGLEEMWTREAKRWKSTSARTLGGKQKQKHENIYNTLYVNII